MMRPSIAALVALAAWAAGVQAASAAPKVTEKTEYYEISGKTGLELFYDMNRRGPRHGFLTKAIAQTRFEHEFLGEIAHRRGVCRTVGGAFRIDITYIYPKPRNRLEGDLARRWKKFQAHNLSHEKKHGSIARQMAGELDRMMRRFAMKDGPSCRRAIAAMKRDAAHIMERYTRLQREFDRQEHRDGGPVDRSVMMLVGKG